jgi:hypothetical protein
MIAVLSALILLVATWLHKRAAATKAAHLAQKGPVS